MSDYLPKDELNPKDPNEPKKPGTPRIVLWIIAAGVGLWMLGSGIIGIINGG